MLKPSIALVHEPDPDTHLQAIIALRHLAENASNRQRIGELNAVRPLLDLTESDNVEVRHTRIHIVHR